jgi:SAM-dependent methyltransferase
MSKISQALAAHYRTTLAEHGPTARGVDWRDDETANIRHAQMLKLILPSDRPFSVLDVGCGYGAFADTLLEAYPNARYHGIDLVEEMVAAGRARHPKQQFSLGDFAEMDLGRFDYIVCNGIFTQKLDASALEMETYFKQMVKKLFTSATIGCAFNLMSTRVNFFAPNLFYRHPAEVMTHCLSDLTNKVRIDHSYGLYEYTVYLYT